jgi:hypothetical protein
VSEQADPAALREQVAQLEERLTTVETTVDRELPLLIGTIRAVVDAEIEAVDELPAAGRSFGQRLADREERLARLETQVELVGKQSSAATKAQKIATVLAFAQNKADDTAKVAVTPEEIRGCTGVSRRYAYDLLETIAADVDGARLRESQQVQTATGTEHKPKAVLIDCERVHDPTAVVKEFTTGGDEGDGV